MPINNPEHYPEDWEHTRAVILWRACTPGGPPRCECEGECGKNHGGRCTLVHGGPISQYRPDSKVILTLAHLDHDASKGNHDYDNLKAYCQGCHLRFDAEHNRAKARRTREDKKGIIPLFEEEILDAPQRG